MIREYGDKGDVSGHLAACATGPGVRHAGAGEEHDLADWLSTVGRAAGYSLGGSVGYETGSLRSYVLRSLRRARITPQSLRATAERAT